MYYTCGCYIFGGGLEPPRHIIDYFIPSTLCGSATKLPEENGRWMGLPRRLDAVIIRRVHPRAMVGRPSPQWFMYMMQIVSRAYGINLYELTNK